MESHTSSMKKTGTSVIGGKSNSSAGTAMLNIGLSMVEAHIAPSAGVTVLSTIF